jgi:hypothetical protein
MKKIFYIAVIFAALGWGCDDESFLNKEPKNILLEAQIWEDESTVLSIVADLYGRYPEFQSVNAWQEFTNFDEAFASNNGDYWRHRDSDFPYDWWRTWNYELIRHVNLFIEKCSEADELLLPSKSRFLAEARLLRAAYYFEMVKRMGGVPLILESMQYDFSGDPSYLRFPRAKEYEVYDFILAELVEVKNDLPNDVNIKSRATQGLDLAMQSRVALYAASIAKYGQNTPLVSLPGGEVGIPAQMADAYYQKALDAAESLLLEGSYGLYKKKENLSDNFAKLFQDKANNPEVIFVKDFLQSEDGAISNPWTLVNQPWSGAEDLEGGRLNPSLNLVQSFEKLDNTYETFQTVDEAGDFIFYDKPEDIFAGRDARLAGTVMLPGSNFKGKDLDIWAGFMLADGTVISGGYFGDRKILPGKDVEEQVVGYDGPIDSREYSAQTGFYVRKHMDEATGSGQRGLKSSTWWVRYRLAEVYLNAAEAAFELGHPDIAAAHMNVVRERAGFTIPLVAADINFDRIFNERKVELAFEGHQLWDMKRWRIAHKVWDGTYQELTNDPGKANSVQTRVFGLWPYKYYDPAGSENNGKYVFIEKLPAEVTGAHNFRLGNYYSSISDDVVNFNPKIVKNPNH